MVRLNFVEYVELRHDGLGVLVHPALVKVRLEVIIPILIIQVDVYTELAGFDRLLQGVE